MIRVFPPFESFLGYGHQSQLVKVEKEDLDLMPLGYFETLQLAKLPQVLKAKPTCLFCIIPPAIFSGVFLHRRRPSRFVRLVGCRHISLQLVAPGAIIFKF